MVILNEHHHGLAALEERTRHMFIGRSSSSFFFVSAASFGRRTSETGHGSGMVIPLLRLLIDQ